MNRNQYYQNNYQAGPNNGSPAGGDFFSNIGHTVNNAVNTAFDALGGLGLNFANTVGDFTQNFNFGNGSPPPQQNFYQAPPQYSPPPQYPPPPGYYQGAPPQPGFYQGAPPPGFQQFIPPGFVQGGYPPGGYPPQQPHRAHNRSGYTRQTNQDVDGGPAGPRPSPSTSAFYKEEGNAFFKQKDYNRAIQSYTKAIEMNNGESIYYSNRAICHRLLKNYPKAIQDANMATELDEKNCKALMVLGQSLGELGKYDSDTKRLLSAINKISKAIKYSTEAKNEKVLKESTTIQFKLRKILWYKEQELKINEKQKILSYLRDIMNADPDSTRAENDIKMAEFAKVIDNPKDRPGPENPNMVVPDYLQCKITMDLMTKPLMNSSGVTYEGAIIKDHYNKNGGFDPITREPVNPQILIHNKNIREAISEFVLKNPWAFEYNEGEVYYDIAL